MDSHQYAIFLWTALFLFSELPVSHSLGEGLSLHSDLFANYTETVRPRANYSEPVEVELDFVLNSIGDLDEVNQVLQTVGFVVAYWRDDYLTWNPADYGGIEHIVVHAKEVWVPDIGLVNSAGAFYDSSYVNNFRVTVHNTGNVSWAFGGTFSTTCSLDLTYYPFDEQKCDVIYENWAYTQEDVDLFSGYSYVVVEDYQTNGIWDYVGSTVTRSTFFHDVHSNLTYPKITFSLYMARKNGYYINSLMLPCILILIVALGVFWMPPDSGEKIGVGITVLLAFSVVQIVINGETPATSDNAPVITSYVLFVMTVSTLSIVMSIAVLYIHHKGAQTRVPQCLRHFLFRYMAAVLCMRSLVPGDKVGDDEEEPDLVSSGGSTMKVQPLDQADDSAKKAQADPGVEQLVNIERHLVYLRQYIKAKDIEQVVMDDWKAVAALLDRFFFWICLLVCVIAFPIFFTSQEPSKFTSTN